MGSNVTKIHASNFLSGFVFWYAIEKLFLRSIGIDAFGISIIFVILIGTVVLFDVPTGVLADKWSRKYCLISAIVLLAISSVLLGVSHGIFGYIIGTIVWSFYLVLISGTYEALLYDSLHERNRHRDYSKIWGRAYSFRMGGIIVSSIIGGLIAGHVSLSSAYFLTTIPCVINILILSSIKEPAFHKEVTDKRFFTHAKDTSMYLLGTKILLNLSLLLMFVSILSHFQNEYSQLYFIALGLSPLLLGFMNAAFSSAAIVGQLSAKKISQRVNYLLPLLVVFFLFFSLWHSRWGLIIFLMTVILRNSIENTTQSEIQDNITSDVRATTLSLVSFAANIITIPLGLLFGWVARDYGIFRAFQMIALLGFAFLAFSTVRRARYLRASF